MAQAQATSTLRQMFDSGVSLTRAFDAVRGRLQDISERLHSDQDEKSSSNAGQAQSSTGVLSLRPYTLVEKLRFLKRLIKEGKLALAEHASIDSLRNELQKPEHAGIGVKEMMKVLFENKLLKKLPRFDFKPEVLPPGLRRPAPLG